VFWNAHLSHITYLQIRGNRCGGLWDVNLMTKWREMGFLVTMVRQPSEDGEGGNTIFARDWED
jgi:hypothetical protein